MLELFLLKKSNHLSAVDIVNIEILQKIDNDTVVKALITQQERNVKRHRLWHALLHVIFEHQTFYLTVDELRAGISIALGSFEMRRKLNGETYPYPLSQSFGKMDEITFSQFFDRALDLIETSIIPGIKGDDVRQHIDEMLYAPRTGD